MLALVEIGRTGQCEAVAVDVLHGVEHHRAIVAAGEHNIAHGDATRLRQFHLPAFAQEGPHTAAINSEAHPAAFGHQVGNGIV